MTSSLPMGPRFPLGPHTTSWPTPKVALQKAEDSSGFPQVSLSRFFTYTSNRVNIDFMDQTSMVLGVRVGASNNDTEMTGLTRRVPGRLLCTVTARSTGFQILPHPGYSLLDIL